MTNADGKQRHGCLTAFLAAGIALTALATLTNLLGKPMMKKAFPDAPDWAFLALGIGGVLHIVCMVALFRWKKGGFHGAILGASLTFVANLAIGIGVGRAVLGLAGVAVLYGVLQIGGDRKAWTQLE